MERYDLTYKYSKDNGLTFIDITEIVNSAQTSIVHNICSAGFKSATDTASFTIPAKDTALKQNLINALLDGSTVLVKILEGDNVIFTGYVNKDNISIRSYPLTASITIEVEDVGTLNLDNKVNEYVYYKNYTITELVHALLTKAGYTYDNSSLATGDEQTLEAFVIDKDNSNTFREYIDTLLFEAGGYVLDFNAQGIASIVKLNWQATGDATLVDNPMDSEGITTKTKILDVDGVSLTWASTKWSDDNNQLLWQDSISRKLEDNYVVGEDVENQHYWPADGELNPIYQEYNSELLDTDYLTNASRKQNEDLAIIVAEDIRAEIQATKNKAEFTSWKYPLIQDFIDNYDLTKNPIAYPKKAWYLLYNDSGETVNIQHFRLYGKVFYKDKKHTLKTKETKNPKEYESQYIYNETHANQFLQFYWHFMQTSRISVTWKEVGANHTLGDVVQVYHKGSLSYVKAIVAGITTTFIGKTKITSYSAVGVASQIIPYPTLSITKLRGSTQAENRGIDNVKVQYATSITQTGTKTSYQDVMPTLHPYTAKYLWQKETIYYTDGTKDVFEDIIAVYGDKGDAGDGITAQYCYSTSPTECTGGTLVWNDADIYWGEEQGVWNWWTTQTLEEKDGFYIWLRTKVGDSDWVYTRLTGVQGLTGNGIVSIVEKYARSESSTEEPTDFDTTIPELTPTYKYLWNYEIVTYTDGTEKETGKRIIGVYGDTGKTGVGISSIVNYYLASSLATGVTRDTAGWDTDPATQKLTADIKYLWNYEKIVYTDDSEAFSEPCIIGTYGDKGDKGDAGKGIVSIVNHYLRTSLSSGVTKDTASWTETIQTVTATERYLWNYETINYTEGEPTDSAPCIIGTYGNGIASITEYYQVSDSNTEAPTSWVTPPQEIPPMTADNRFLWNYEKITYNDGTYKETVKRVIGAYGESGTPARVCTISCDKSVVIRNDRLTTSEIYTFTIEVQGYSATPSVKITVDGTSTTLDVTKSTVSDTTWYAVYSQALLNASAITANLYMDDVLMDTITLSVVDETQQAYYIGVSEADPVASAYGTLLIGDWYLDKTTNVVKIYNGETWDDLDNSAFDTSENLQKVSVCMADMIKIGTTNKTTATLLGVFKYLCADEAFVKSLFAEKISVLKEGYIQSENYDDGGDKRFKIQANGEAEFYGLKASEVEVSGDFSSSGFRTQKSSDEIPLSQSQQTANAWDSAIFFAKAIDIYNANYELKKTINNGESSIYCAPITATWYGNTINYVGLFDKYSNNPIIGYTETLSYQVFPFNYDGGDKNTISGAWLIKSSVRSEKVLAFFSSKRGANILSTKEVHGSLMYVYTSAVGDSSASVRNSLTYESIGGWGFALLSAESTYDDWKPSTAFPYLSIIPGTHTTCVSPSYVATVGDWSTANNLNLYYISNLSSLNIPTSWSAWIGTITMGNNSYISSASSLRYIYKKNDGIVISKNNAFSCEEYISIFSLEAWSISISILSGIDGIAVKNIVPYTTGEGNVGTETLRFNEGYINNLTGNVNSEGDTEHKVYGAVFN